MYGRRSLLFLVVLLVLLAGTNAFIARSASGVTSEPVSVSKVVAAVVMQLLAVALLPFLVTWFRASGDSIGPWEHFRRWAMPCFVFAFFVAIALSLLYNAVACGEQSFFKSRRGAPECVLPGKA